jgi:hypothetical protein
MKTDWLEHIDAKIQELCIPPVDWDEVKTLAENLDLDAPAVFGKLIDRLDQPNAPLDYLRSSVDAIPNARQPPPHNPKKNSRRGQPIASAFTCSCSPEAYRPADFLLRPVPCELIFAH